MDLDLLDKTYTMGKSKLPFKDFGQGGLTGLVGQSNRVCPDLPNLGVNKMIFCVAMRMTWRRQDLAGGNKLSTKSWLEH
jgi:hypothetical protein